MKFAKQAVDLLGQQPAVHARTTEWFSPNSRGSHDPRMPQAVNQPWKGWPMRGVRALSSAHRTTPLGLVSWPCRPGVTSTPGYSGRTPLGFLAHREPENGHQSRTWFKKGPTSFNSVTTNSPPRPRRRCNAVPKGQDDSRTTEWFSTNSRGSHDPRSPQRAIPTPEGLANARTINL